ncbi:unnamed protein product [Rotaria socialis]|uniref:F-box domain-containing protein n=1 Tax=Rotaria socialis TaxID=392032 RepID=A0A820WW54_9BILA|nr:unnamed protein product [Rotaria socialis]CAF4523775.1 unnamed protein product [Rotaria socialis]
MTASNVNIAPLSSLPVELIFRILSFADNKTIIFSFGNVCKRFRSIINSYNQYDIDFRSVSKPYFDAICHFITPENIISLTLSNNNRTTNQISLFLSLVPFEKCIRLRSLTLVDIDENDFHTIFQLKNMIVSLSFTFRKKNSIQNPKTLPLIYTIISNENLQHLDFGLSWNRMEALPWPNQCRLESLILSSRISFKKFSSILSHCSKLKRLLLQDCVMEDLTEIDRSTTYPQLTSLAFDDSELHMDEFELLLSLTPSLQHLHIVGETDLFDGACWEKFIQKHLKNLNRFEFAFCGNTDYEFNNPTDVESLITSYRTPFWIENKHWFVICYYFKKSASYSLYSLPICKTKVRFYPHEDKITCSTHSTLYNDASMTDNVHEMQLNLTNLMAHYDRNAKNALPSSPFFRKMNKLLLLTGNEWPDGSSEYLSAFIDLSCIVELSVSVDFDPNDISNTLTNITNLLKGTSNLQSLTIDSSSTNAENICLLVPNHIKHLQVAIQSIDEMKLIVERLKQLSSITFNMLLDINSFLPDFLTWLMEKRNQSTYRNDTGYFSIWFNKNTAQIP